MKRAVVLTLDPVFADDLARDLPWDTALRTHRDPYAVARSLRPRNDYVVLIDLDLPDHAIRALSFMLRASTAHVRVIGLRRRYNVFRDSMLIAQGLVDRIVTDIRDRETLRKLDLLPAAG